MMHPDAGQAATASGTPLGKRSAKMVFSRLRKATTPSKSVIWESCIAPPAANFGTVFWVRTAAIEDGGGNDKLKRLKRWPQPLIEMYN